MKQTIIETTDGYKVDVVEKVDNVLIRFMKEENEKFVPKDGDVVYDQSCNECCNNISIYKTQKVAYVRLFVESKNLSFEDNVMYEYIRPATPEEAQLLFDALKEEGKRWNAENKCVEEMPKPFVIKKGDVFRCIEDVVMNGSGKTEYIKGRIYLSENSGCLTDESGDEDHIWSGSQSTFFEKLGTLNTDNG